jgi:hypothetical protein
MFVKDFTSFVNESKKTDSENHLKDIGLLPKGNRDWVDDNYEEIIDRCHYKENDKIPNKATVLRFIKQYTNNNPDITFNNIDYSDFFEWYDH